MTFVKPPKPTPGRFMVRCGDYPDIRHHSGWNAAIASHQDSGKDFRGRIVGFYGKREYGSLGRHAATKSDRWRTTNVLFDNVVCRGA
jgi:hypothetical protein